MAPCVISSEGISCVPEDGFDDSEFTEYLEGDGHVERAQPNLLTKRISSVVEEAWSMCRSVVDRSSQVISVLARDAKEDTCAVDYIETARSLLHRIHTDYDEIRNIVTGGAADAWYPASSQVPSPPPCLGMVLCFGSSMMPAPIPITSFGATANQTIAPCLPCNAIATQLGNKVERLNWADASEVGSHSPTPVVERTPLRPAAALFEPTINCQVGDMDIEAAPKTTLILRNIPSGISRSVVMDVIRSEGFADHVAFIYLPMNLRSAGNFGYAFVDFDSSKIAEHCKDKLDGFIGWGEPSEKALEVAWSETQGLHAHVQRYRDSPLMHDSVEDEVKPAMFKHGVRVAFPRPTKPIRAPRLRKTGNQ